MKPFFLSLAAAATLCAADVYRVAGVVVDSESGAPVENASVSLAPTELPGGQLLAVTGRDGRFVFDAPRGVLRLSAVVAGISQTFGDASPFADLGSAVITGPDKDTAHLVFRWFRSAVITGRVVDDQGEPEANANVQLIHSGVEEGRRRVTPQNEVSTDDRGEYRFWGVPGAAYYVAVTAKPWFTLMGLASPDKTQASYETMYYPDTTDATRATPLVVRPGEEARADFALKLMSAATVHVNCGGDPGDAPVLDDRGLMLVRVIAEGVGGTQTTVSQIALRNCQAIVTGIAPGRYLVRLSNPRPENPMAAQRWIDVGAGDMAVSLSLHPAASISGTVTFRKGGTRPGGLRVRLFREVDNTSVEAAIAADGGFSFQSVDPGRYLASVDGSSYYVETVRSGDATLPGGVVNIEDGGEPKLSIVANNETGHLKGFSVRGEESASAMLVVLVPADSASAHAILGYQTESDGSFDWPPLPVGKYLLFAVDDLTLAYADADVIKPYLAKAKSIRIEPGKVLEERVPVQAVVK